MTDSILVCDAQCASLPHVHDSPWVEHEIATHQGTQRHYTYDITLWKRVRPATWAERAAWTAARRG